MTTRFERIRRQVDGIGFVQLATRARTQREHERRVVTFDELCDDSQLGVIRALIAGDVTWGEVIEARRQGKLRGAGVLTTIALEKELAAAIDATLSKMGRGAATRRRYRVTAEQVKRALAKESALWWPEGTAPLTFCVKHLSGVQWSSLKAHWLLERSAADWNHVRRMLSAFLSKFLGQKHHPFATEVRALIPIEHEEARVPDLTPSLFWLIFDKASEHVRPAFITILLTGARVRTEYLRMTEAHLMPQRCAVRLPGTKTDLSQRVVAIPEEYWPWVESGVPSPLGYKWLRMQWMRACVAAGAGAWTDPENENGYVGLQMRDLRHALGQWASDANVPLDRIMDTLGHTNPAMTARYTRVSASNQVARAAGDALRKAR